MLCRSLSLLRSNLGSSRLPSVRLNYPIVEWLRWLEGMREFVQPFRGRHEVDFVFVHHFILLDDSVPVVLFGATEQSLGGRIASSA